MGRLLAVMEGVGSAAVARGEERKEDAVVGGHGGVTALDAVNVSECKVVLSAGADVLEVLAGERVRAVQGSTIGVGGGG